MATEKIFAEIAAARERQDGRWGDAVHDDDITMGAFVERIADDAGGACGKARGGSVDEAPQRPVQAAALAVATRRATRPQEGGDRAGQHRRNPEARA